MTPIGTKYVPPPSRLEQRTHNTFQHTSPWPDKDASRVQGALLGAKPERPWLTAFLYLTLAVSLMLLLRACS
jgi:hypothetical protein